MAGLVAFISSFIFKPKPQEECFYTKHFVPLPKTCHLVLDDDVIKNKSIFVIGDVHGCYDEMCELLSLAESEEQGRQILPIFVGDLVSKGPKSGLVLQKLRNMEAYAVRGNHDEAVQKHLLKRRSTKDYSPPEKYKWTKELTEADCDFLSELPFTISIPQLNSVVVHAGLIPNIPLHQQNYNDLIVMRNIERKADGHIAASESRYTGQPWASLWTGPQHVYFGHDAARGFQDHPFATGLDTGCCYGFKLTGMFLNGCKKKISVNARAVYREPDEVNVVNKK